LYLSLLLTLKDYNKLKKLNMRLKDKKFFKEYVNESCRALQSLDLKKLELITQIIFQKIKANKKIFVCGNGGASSISNHFLCDFNKGIKTTSKKKLKPKIISLTNSVEIITAISNDENYENIFVNQIENYAEKNDLIITFSCSGKSKNIIKLLNYARKNKIRIIKFVGFSKKSNLNKNDITYSLNLNNYGVSEDIFQAITHMISQYIRSRFISNYKFKISKL
tara:strand:- start:377 stop:1042 length:666 start_codon:yes stop_codon:yes gene_type:complete